MSITYVTPNFSWAEFDSHDGAQLVDAVQPHIRRLCESVLEPLRARWGGPLVVTSGWRSPQWNTRLGGARGSRHMSGEAADIRPVQMDRVTHLYRLILDMVGDGAMDELGGLGRYRGWVHVDIRPRKAGGALAMWSGSGVGSESA